jgi:flagellar M-ring protein FliF
LVASAVDNLKPENVTLINADGGLPILARGGGTASRPRYWAEFETALAQKVIATLEPVVGTGKARANVTVEYDLATSDSTQETYDPNGAVVLTSQTSEERDSETDANAQGTPGTPANVPGKQSTVPVKVTPPDTSESARLRTDNKTFAVSKTVRHTVQPSGTIKRMTAAVLVDDATETKEENGQTTEQRRKRTPEEMKQIEELVTAAIGVDATRGDKVAVANLSFQTLPPEELPPPTLTERVAPLVDKWINVVRYGALFLLFLLVYVLVLRPIRRQIVATLQALPRQLGMAKSSATLKAGGSPGLAGKPEATPGLETPAPAQFGEASGEVQQAVLLKKNLLDKVKKEPATASRLIQNWVRQEIKS